MSLAYGRLITCSLSELHPHPSYIRHQLSATAAQLSRLAALGDLAFQEPIVVSQSRLIVDGYARFQLARAQGRLIVPCIEYELTEMEVLRWLLHRHRRSDGLNDFSRILLALELETPFKEKARANQQLGGKCKGSSKLTEPREWDVRREIAAVAGVSTGNVTKVKQLTTNAHTKLIEALRAGEISIHRAWLCCKVAPEEQLEALRTYQSERGVKRQIRALVARHRHHRPRIPGGPDPASLLKRLSTIESGQLPPFSLFVVKAPGKAVFVTEELFQFLKSQEESVPSCATSSL